MKYFMGIDIGTNASKGVLTDEELNIISQGSVEHETENPAPGFYEHDAEAVWWGDFCRLSRKLIADAGIDPADIACVGNSALSADVVPVDRLCRPLRKAILYGIDSRASEEIEYLNERYGEERLEELFDGEPLCSSDCMPKILWIRNHEPEIYEKTYKFLTASSYLTAKLTGEYVIDRYLAISSFQPVYGPDLSISRELTEEFYCRTDQLAAGRETAEIVGYVTTEAALETGLAEGTPVVTGTDDSGAEAISTGVLTPGDFMAQLGSSCYMMYCTDLLFYDDRLWTGDFLIPGTYCIEGGTNTAGALTKWVRDIFYQDLLEEEKRAGDSAFSVMAKRAESIPPGSGGVMVLPYFAGERTPIDDADATGIIFGLTTGHTRDHILRASLEAIAYSIAQHVDIMEENGAEISEIKCVGGGARNNTWLQIIADVTGKTVKTAEVTIGASYGDAMIAAIGSGHVRDFGSLRDCIREGNRFEPQSDVHRFYETRKPVFRDLYRDNKDKMHFLQEKKR